MEKRLIAAIALSILVIALFQVMMRPARQKHSPTSYPAASRNNIVTQPEKGTPEKESIRRDASEKKETIAETDTYILAFTNEGGSLTGIKLKEYTDSSAAPGLELTSVERGDRAIFSMQSNVLIGKLDEQFFDLTKKTKEKIEYTYLVPGKFKVTKTYHLPKSNDYIELRVAIQNLGGAVIHKDYDLIGPSGLRSSNLAMGRRFLEISSMVDGKIVRHSKVKYGEAFINGIVAWTGTKERYFSLILKPLQDSEGVIIKQFGKNELASGVRSKRMPIYPDSGIEDTYVLYVGPNDANRMKGLGFGFEQIINYGIFGGISKFLLVVLRTFYKVTHNWGIAIILLTLLINITLFPLTRKSFSSMKRIQDVQPHIEKLRKVHKDNPQKLNKELAEVYRQYKINPLGGCLPLLIQMPIFIALYQGLIRSVELKGSTFLWIRDLSSPDSVHLPFSLPILGNQIHILPLLMVGAMFLQQKISSQNNASASSEQKQQQKIMLIFFPLFFGFLFYKFPSGLVLYWLTNTVLMVIEHSAMRKSPKIA